MKKEELIFGVIGVHNMGTAHLKGAIKYGAKIGGVCDIKPGKAARVCRENGLPESIATTDYMDIVNNSEINAVILATPDQLHREEISACLKAGKHIMCEKPLALTREDLEAIIADVNAHPECKVMVGQICRFTPAFVKAKKIIDSGRLGELYFVESEYAHDYQHLYEENPTGWRWTAERNGVVGGGCHAVDLLRWLVGGDPIEVYAHGTHKLLPGVPYDDANLAIMKFPGDVMGKIFVSTGCKRNYTMRTCVYGTKGTLIFDNKSEYMEGFFADDDGHGATGKPVLIPVEINDHNATAEVKVFADTLVNEKEMETTIYEGAKTVEACLAIVEASNTGKIVFPNYSF